MWTQVHVRAMLSSVRLSSVCRLYVTFVHPTQPVVSTPFGTLDIRWYERKILRRSFQGKPSVWGQRVNARGVSKYSDFGHIEGYISETVQIGGKLVLITNRKSYMSCRLVPKSVTFNDHEQRNGPIFCYFTEFGSFRGSLRSCWRCRLIKKFTFAVSSRDQFLVIFCNLG